MTLQPSGPISFTNIEGEFGQISTARGQLGSYRVSETYGGLSNQPLDAGIPTSGPIRFSNFYNKKLNIIVNVYSGSNENRVNAKTRFQQAGFSSVIGGSVTGKTVPASTTGTKVRVHVNKLIGSAKGSAQYCALRTGTWDADTELYIELGNSGVIKGAGGNGGRGGGLQQFTGSNGAIGSSGLGIQHNGTIVNLFGSGSRIERGYGGGGGGGAARDTSKSGRVETSGAGGGGGGQGVPAGSGGAGGLTSTQQTGGAGGAGSATGRGGGGSARNLVQGIAGNGGRGGGLGQSAVAGQRASRGDAGLYNGGNAGGNGNAIRIASGVSYSFGTVQGTVTGGTGSGVA